MGPPANLADFRKLASQVAEGTGYIIGEFEAEDRFLGRIAVSNDRGKTWTRYTETGHGWGTGATVTRRAQQNACTALVGDATNALS